MLSGRHALELVAYGATLETFAKRGLWSGEADNVLKDLRACLHITEERHNSEVARVEVLQVTGGDETDEDKDVLKVARAEEPQRKSKVVPRAEESGEEDEEDGVSRKGRRGLPTVKISVAKKPKATARSPSKAPIRLSKKEIPVVKPRKRVEEVVDETLRDRSAETFAEPVRSRSGRVILPKKKDEDEDSVDREKQSPARPATKKRKRESSKADADDDGAEPPAVRVPVVELLPEDGPKDPLACPETIEAPASPAVVPTDVPNDLLVAPSENVEFDAQPMDTVDLLLQRSRS